MINQRTSKRRAAYYAGLNELYEPERYFLNACVAQTDAFLDIGVGAGRTTLHFQPRVARYVGVDYSQEMLRALRVRFPMIPQDDIAFADARSLPYEDSTFDRALFSANGIDYVPRGDRARVFFEIRRVLKHDGSFLFSTHNVDWNGLLDQFCVNVSDWRSPVAMAHRLRSHARNGMLNIRAKIESARLRGQGTLAERDARCCHTSYANELTELAECGFTHVRVFDFVGNEVDNAAALRSSPFMHFIVHC